jgi:NAD(P)-dependent dehydrogenase (short-subunit alcohol dehydrogenase family)
VIGLDRSNEPAGDAEWVRVRADLIEIVNDEGACDRVLGQIREHLPEGRLAALVNNAAIQIVLPTEELSIEDWRQTLDVNLVAPFVLSQQLLPELEAASGSVVNIASVHSTATKPGFVSYATSKAALSGMTRALAVDLGGRVRFNAIVPAATSTPMLRQGFAGNEAAMAELGAMHPLGRIAEPQEVAAAAVFLASKAASFVTGVSLNVDGGILARLHDPE